MTEKPPVPHKASGHIVLTSHRRDGDHMPKIKWGAPTADERGPIIASLADHKQSNVIGAYAGAYSLYRAIAVATGALNPLHIPDLHNTSPAAIIGPHPQWGQHGKIVSLDPWGHMAGQVFDSQRAAGYDVRPTIAITRAHVNMPETSQAIAAGRLKPDGDILLADGSVKVVKAAIDPVWYLPGVAERLGVDEKDLRRAMFEKSGGMFPELVTRHDLKVFLPPIGGQTVYFVGDMDALTNPAKKVACRVHDECNGSDVFGSDICTCRPYLVHGLEMCVETAQQGGVGILVYNRKEGRALGEVTKFLVYNARKRQEGGDRADKYFERTECVAGVQDMRFQELMPDVFHWLGVTKIDRMASMSNMKFDALMRAGIEIDERVAIPPELIPADASVEMEAKKAAGYFTPEPVPDADKLARTIGRTLES